ncbi:SdpI family protein [Paenibacillus sp. MWE-103]|uniref:SdpI family protein n=1 Tax=Paenibacillus artemisiicola TaxID=1172618 RepID=A0ABS3WKJ0_9BACL|nr:SdpI family protein [Paenibacillus artemisiicola]MBO7748844.1 SdpI family protein [Paenibacillus artemisiicola]
MTMRNKREALYLLIGLSPAIGALLLYNRLPDTMATHFGPDNEVNGTMGKGAAVLVLALLGFVPLLLRIRRSLDPKRANFQSFGKAFEVSRFGITLLLGAAGWAMVAYNLGYDVDMRKIVLAAVGLLFAVMGNYMTQVRHNYMFGIRTPWTLANEEVWRKTHRIGGPLMMLGGLVALVAAFFEGTAPIVLFLAAILATSLIPVAYSYVLYRRLRG